MFEWQEQYLTSERSERVKYCSCHKNIKFISWKTNSTKAKRGNSDVIERYDTYKGDMRKIRHSCSGWSGVWNLRVVLVPSKHSPLYNKKIFWMCHIRTGNYWIHEIWLAKVEIESGVDFPSSLASRPVMFCGEKLQTKMQKILSIFFYQYSFMEVPKNVIRKKVKRTSKLWKK